MAHYTCINTSREKILNDLNYLSKKGIENLMLLRGDLPVSGEKALDVEFQHASDLIELAHSLDQFCLGAAGYPEKHPESNSSNEDINWLKHKIDKGASFIVTQMFFNNDHYFDFVMKARNAGITNRIIPGIMPITNFNQIKKFSDMCGATIPSEIISQLSPIQNDKEKMYKKGVDIAIKQCIDLLKKGAPGLHFYTLNKSRATVDIFSSLPHGLTH